MDPLDLIADPRLLPEPFSCVFFSLLGSCCVESVPVHGFELDLFERASSSLFCVIDVERWIRKKLLWGLILGHRPSWRCF